MRSTPAALAALTVLFAASAHGQAVPKQMAWTAYDTGSSGFNMAVAIGQAFKNVHGADIRVLPGTNDIARLGPVRGGRAQMSMAGIGTYFAIEGIDEFGAKDWGPQRLRRIVASLADNTIALGTAADANIHALTDLKGKRIAWVVGAPALNRNLAAHLAFAGLTWNDVKKIEFSGYGASWKGMVSGEVDAAIASTISGQVRELESSPRGLRFPPAPHGDEAGWKRLQSVAPYYVKAVATQGAGGISKDKPMQGPNYPYPILVAYDTQATDLVYAVTKNIIELYPQYKDGAPGADGFELKRQALDWVIPYHEGAVRAFKEKGHWTDAAQRHNDMLVKRQDALAQAWGKMQDKKTLADADYAKAWMAARAETLKAAGFDPIWTDW